MMEGDVVILVTDDDVGHATLIKKNLRRAGINNEILHFKDGQEVLEFLKREGEGPHREPNVPYLLLLDIRMPKVDGTEVLRQIKEEEALKKMPVLMISTTDDPREIDKCHSLGCSTYVVKPVDYEQFIEAIRKLGFFLKVIRVPTLNGESS